MNPIRMFTIYRRAQKLAGYMEEAAMSKSLWKSRTFWFNLLTAAAELTAVLPLPPGTLTIAAAVINVALRLVTSEPVHVL